MALNLNPPPITVDANDWTFKKWFNDIYNFQKIRVESFWVEDFGAKGDFNPATSVGTDDTIAIQTAIDTAQNSALNGGVIRVRFKAKNYRCSKNITVAADATKPIVIEGMGTTTYSTAGSAQVSTRLFFTAGSIGIFVSNAYAYGNSLSGCNFTIRNLEIHNKGGTGTVGLKIGVSTGQIDGTTKSLVENVLCTGWLNGLRIDNARQIEFRKITIDSTGIAGSDACLITCEGTTHFTGDLAFYNCDFIGSKIDVNCHACLVYQNNAVGAGGGNGAIAGLHFQDCNFYFGQNGLRILNNAAANIQDIFINQCAFDGAASVTGSIGLACVALSTGYFFNIGVRGCYSENWDYGYYFQSTNLGILAAVRMVGNYAALNPNVGTYFENVTTFACSDNSYVRVGSNPATQPGIRIVGACSLFTVTGNVFRDAFLATAGSVIGWLVKVDNTTAEDFVIANNVGQCVTAAVSDSSTGTNKSITGNIKL